MIKQNKTFYVVLSSFLQNQEFTLAPPNFKSIIEKYIEFFSYTPIITKPS